MTGAGPEPELEVSEAGEHAAGVRGVAGSNTPTSKSVVISVAPAAGG